MSVLVHFSFILITFQSALSQIEWTINYPVKLMLPVTGSVFSGEFTNHQITCFGNQDYREATFIETITCLVGFIGEGANTNSFVSNRFGCYGIWGSRSVSVSVNGSIELLRVGNCKLSTIIPILYLIIRKDAERV